MTTNALTTRHTRRRSAPAAPVLERAVGALATKRKADADLLVAAAEWAEANPAGPGTAEATPAG